jgi:hypothetical protein
MMFQGARRGEYKHMQHIGPLHVVLHELVLDEEQDHQQVLVRSRMTQETAVSCA